MFCGVHVTSTLHVSKVNTVNAFEECFFGPVLAGVGFTAGDAGMGAQGRPLSSERCATPLYAVNTFPDMVLGPTLFSRDRFFISYLDQI